MMNSINILSNGMINTSGVVIASEGYPESYESNKEVSFASSEEENTNYFMQVLYLIMIRS